MIIKTQRRPVNLNNAVPCGTWVRADWLFSLHLLSTGFNDTKFDFPDSPEK